jgi:hypothetical protein
LINQPIIPNNLPINQILLQNPSILPLLTALAQQNPSDPQQQQLANPNLYNLNPSSVQPSSNNFYNSSNDPRRDHQN